MLVRVSFIYILPFRRSTATTLFKPLVAAPTGGVKFEPHAHNKWIKGHCLVVKGR